MSDKHFVNVNYGLKLCHRSLKCLIYNNHLTVIKLLSKIISEIFETFHKHFVDVNYALKLGQKSLKLSNFRLTFCQSKL
jgi:hypothetical protein